MDDCCHVLIVDDERDFRISLGMLLEAQGYCVSEAGTGDEALALLDGGLLPDVVLIDQRMPGLTGAEAYVKMLERGFHRPALLVSAMSDVESVARSYGFAGAVAKPFSPDALIDRIRFVACPGAGGQETSS